MHLPYSHRPTWNSWSWVAASLLPLFGWTGGLQAAETVLLSPVADATLYESSSGAFANGQGPGMFVGMNNSSTIRRSLVRFDLSVIPPGHEVISATLRIQANRSNGAVSDVTLHRVNSSWTEGPSHAGTLRDGMGVGSQAGDVTWIHRSLGTSSWVNPGGDFEAVASMRFVNIGVGDWTRNANGLLADIAFFLQNPAQNFGWMLRGNESESGSALRLASSEAGSTEMPVLSLTYQPIPEPAPEMRITGDGTEIPDGDVSPTPADHTDFGSQTVVVGNITRTFTLSNSGDLALNLTGTPKVAISGPHAGDFTATAQPLSPVAAAEFTTFQISFDPSATGTRTATVSISNDDADENPYDFVIQGMGVNYAPTVTLVTPSSGSAAGGTVTTITGTDFIGATSVTFGGTAAANFTVDSATQITATTPAGAVGGASVVVTTSGGSNPPNAFFTYITAKIALSGGSAVIMDGDATPSLTDHTDFGLVPLFAQQVTRTFTISNEGPLPLNLTGANLVQISGAAAGDFKVILQPASTIPSGESTQFDITFDPKLPGTRQATISIASDDRSNPSFSFAIAGSGGLSQLLAQTITFAPPATLYLGQSPFALSALSSSALPVAFRVVSGPASIAGSLLTLTGPGTVKVEATQTGGGNYAAAAPVVKTIIVKANPTTLTLINLAQTYDGLPKPISTLGGGAAAISYKVGSTFGTNPPTAAGSYAVKALAGGVTKTGNLVIAKAPLHVTPEDKRKFAGKANPSLSYTLNGFRGSDTALTVTKAPVLKTTATTTSPSGHYPITAAGATAANYTFIYQQGVMVVEGFAGSYEALLLDNNSTAIGKLSLTVSSPGTAFTAKLASATETSSLSFKGTVFTDPQLEHATGTASVTKSNIPYTIDFTLPLTGVITASASRNGASLGSAVDGQKLSNAAVTYAGAHTVVMEPALPAASSVPVGAGWATAVISSKGIMTLKGKLGDGAAFTTVVSPDQMSDPGYRVFVQPYLAARIQSFFSGSFILTPHPSLGLRRHVTSAELVWKKVGLPADASYRAGFGPVSMTFALDPWLKPTSATKTLPAVTLPQRLGISLPNFGVSHSPVGGGADDDLPTRLALSPANAVTVQTPAANLTRWKTTKFNSSDGTFTGSFVSPTGPATFSGVLRQPADSLDAVIGDGHFLVPAAGSTEKLSGEVRFHRP